MYFSLVKSMLFSILQTIHRNKKMQNITVKNPGLIRLINKTDNYYIELPAPFGTRVPDLAAALNLISKEFSGYTAISGNTILEQSDPPEYHYYSLIDSQNNVGLCLLMSNDKLFVANINLTTNKFILDSQLKKFLKEQGIKDIYKNIETLTGINVYKDASLQLWDEFREKNSIITPTKSISSIEIKEL